MSSIDDAKMPSSFSLPFLHSAPESPPRDQKERQLASKWWTGVQKQRQKGARNDSIDDDARKKSLGRLCKGCWCHGCHAEFHGQERCDCSPSEKEKTPTRQLLNAPLTPPPSLDSVDGERNSQSSQVTGTTKKLQKPHSRQVHFLPAPKPIKPIAQSLLPSPAIAEPDVTTGFNNFSFNFQNPRSEIPEEESVPPSYDGIVEEYSHENPNTSHDAKQALRKESAPAVLQKLSTPVRQPKWSVFPHASAGQDRRASTTEAKWLAGNLKNCEPWLKRPPNSRNQRNFSIVEAMQEEPYMESPAMLSTKVTTEVIPEEPKEDVSCSDPSEMTSLIPQSSSSHPITAPQTPQQNIEAPEDISHFSPDTPPQSPDRPQAPPPDQARPQTPTGQPHDKPRTTPAHVRSHPSPLRTIPVRFKRRGHSRSASSLAGSQRAESGSQFAQLQQPQRSFSVDETGSKLRRKLGIASPEKQSPLKPALHRRGGHEAPPPSPPSSSSRRTFRTHSRHPSSTSSNAISPLTSPPKIDHAALLARCTLLEPVLLHLQNTLRSFPALTLRLEDPIIRRLRSPTSSDATHIATLGRVFAHAPPPLLSALAASTIAESFLRACFSAGAAIDLDLSVGQTCPSSPSQGQGDTSQLDLFIARLRATESADPSSSPPPSTWTSTSATTSATAGHHPHGPTTMNPSTTASTTTTSSSSSSSSSSAKAKAYALSLSSRAKALHSSLDTVISALLEALCGEPGDFVCRRFLAVVVDVVEN